jgi:hypothetical protein
VLENREEGYENVPNDQENLPTHDKKAMGKKVVRERLVK